MTQPQPPTPLPMINASYTGSGCSFVIDKTGTTFQVTVCNLVDGGPWGPHVVRTVKGGKPQIVWFVVGSAGTLVILNKQLYMGYVDSHGQQWYQLIDGYIDPSDTPSSQVVNVDESALNAVKQSVTVANNNANQAGATANGAQDTANGAMANTQQLKARITALEQQVATMQNQINQLLTPNQVADLVWSKVWDANYQIRMGFLAGKSTIQQVQDYLNDLAVYIRNVVKK
jgi:archaellum component FlaC